MTKSNLTRRGVLKSGALGGVEHDQLAALLPQQLEHPGHAHRMGFGAFQFGDDLGAFLDLGNLFRRARQVRYHALPEHLHPGVEIPVRSRAAPIRTGNDLPAPAQERG